MASKAPRKATSAEVVDLAIPQIVARYGVEFRRVVHDVAVWREERAKPAVGLVTVPWAEGTSYERMLAVLFDAHVQATLMLMEGLADAGLPDRPLSFDDPKLQVLLRVAHRGHLVAKSAIDAEFGGANATGWREWKNRFRELAADQAVRSRLPRDEALALFGVAKTTYYSALERAGKRRRNR